MRRIKEGIGKSAAAVANAISDAGSGATPPPLMVIEPLTNPTPSSSSFAKENPVFRPNVV